MAELEVHDKRMSVAEAVRRFIPDGCRLRSCGIGLRKPMAFVYEIMRQRRRDLTFLQSGMTEDADLLVGAGCVARIEGSYLGLEAFGLAHCYRRAVERGVPRRIEIEEYSNFGMTMRFMAAAMGLPFMPIRSQLGSDLLRVESFVHPKAAVLEDPFGSGGKVALLPACSVDVALLHAQRCDEEGNVQVWGQLGDDVWGATAGRRIVVGVEGVVPTKVVRRDPNRTIVPGFRVDAIVAAPFGAHPYQVQGCYDADAAFRGDYAARSANLDGWTAWADEWVYGVEDHAGYLRKLGEARLDGLRAKRLLSGQVNYGY
ncbi:MAG: CoA transferase subunit A [Methanobacteriota archaeon]